MLGLFIFSCRKWFLGDEKCEHKYVFAVNDQNQLMAYGYKVGSKTLFSALSDLRPVQGITIPFHEVSTSGQQKLDIKYDNMEANPVFDAQSWAVPSAN